MGEGSAKIPLGGINQTSWIERPYIGSTMADTYVWNRNDIAALVYKANADDASGSTKPTGGFIDSSIEVSACGFARSHAEFTSWNTEPDGSGDAYAPGSGFTLTAGPNVLFAQWKLTVSKRFVIRSEDADGGPVQGACYVLGSTDGDAGSCALAAVGTAIAVAWHVRRAVR